MPKKDKNQKINTQSWKSALDMWQEEEGKEEEAEGKEEEADRIDHDSELDSEVNSKSHKKSVGSVSVQNEYRTLNGLRVNGFRVDGLRLKDVPSAEDLEDIYQEIIRRKSIKKTIKLKRKKTDTFDRYD